MRLIGVEVCCLGSDEKPADSDKWALAERSTRVAVDYLFEEWALEAYSAARLFSLILHGPIFGLNAQEVMTEANRNRSPWKVQVGKGDDQMLWRGTWGLIWRMRWRSLPCIE